MDRIKQLGVRVAILVAFGVASGVSAAASEQPTAPLADASPDAKKAVELLEGAKGMLERATAKGDHREKALESVGQALKAIGGAAPAAAKPVQGGHDLAADSRLVSALKLLLGAKASLAKAGANYAGAKGHVESAIEHVKAAIAAG